MIDNIGDWRADPRVRQIWQQVCPGVDEVLNDYARLKGGEVSELQFGAPAKAVRWYGDDTSHALSVIAHMRKPILYVSGIILRSNPGGDTKAKVQTPEFTVATNKAAIEAQDLRLALRLVDADLTDAMQALMGRSKRFYVATMPIPKIVQFPS